MEFELKKGDIIYKCYRNVPQNKIVIERTTKTQAVSDKQKFKIKYRKGGWIIAIGNTNSFNMYSYYLETPELLNTYKRELIIKKLEQTDFRKLKNSQLNELCNVL